jgi:purine-nucleoside phosphorylase
VRKALPEAADVRVLVIAGSGLGGFVKSVASERELQYHNIPGIGGSTVEGHAGKLVFAHAGADRTPILLMAGRRHLYEGLSAAEASRLPQSILQAFPNVRSVVISNAAGGLNPTFAVGDLMLISDQVNWMFKNPLVGPNREEWGPRFPDVCDIYSNKLRELAKQSARELGITLRQGVYIAMHGPSYETRAEVAMTRHLLGADAVGMSTVPEALVASHAGRQVLGISFISNMLTAPAVTSHDEVVSNAALVEERFAGLINGLLPQLHNQQ